jgi:hypothetical protein
MPPKSRSRKRTRGGVAPPSSPPPPPPEAMDTSFDFLASVPSPVTLLPSQGSQPTLSSTVTPSVPPPSAQGAAPPSISAGADPYAFMANVPSPVTFPPVSQGQPSVPATPAARAAPTTPAAPAAASPTPQSAALPTPTGGDSAFDFLEKVPSPVILAPAHADQGADTVSIHITSGILMAHLTIHRLSPVIFQCSMPALSSFNRTSTG